MHKKKPEDKLDLYIAKAMRRYNPETATELVNLSNQNILFPKKRLEKT